MSVYAAISDLKPSRASSSRAMRSRRAETVFKTASQIREAIDDDETVRVLLATASRRTEDGSHVSRRTKDGSRLIQVNFSNGNAPRDLHQILH